MKVKANKAASRDKKVKSKLDLKAKKEKKVKKLKVDSDTAKEIKKDLVAKAGDLSTTAGERRMVKWILYLKTWVEDSLKSSRLTDDEREVVKKCSSFNAVPHKKMRFCNYVKHILGKNKEVSQEVSTSLFDKIHDGFTDWKENNTNNSEDEPSTSGKWETVQKSKGKKRKSNGKNVNEETNEADAPAGNEKSESNDSDMEEEMDEDDFPVEIKKSKTIKTKGKKGTSPKAAKTNGVNKTPKKGKKNKKK